MRQFCALLLLAGMPLMADERKTNNVYMTQWDNVLPQLVDGPGWTSRITLVNMSTTAATYTLWFYNEDGSPWNIQFKGLTGASNKWSGTIPVGGSIFLETPGTAGATTVGWAYLDSGTFWVSGLAAFKAGWLASNDKEAMVPFGSEADNHFFIPFDNRSGYVTSVAIANPWLDRSAPVTMQFRAQDGSVIRLDSFTLAPLTHMAFETTGKYPETVGKNGVIEFTVTGNAGAASLGLLFNDARNSFTSVPPVSIDPHYF